VEPRKLLLIVISAGAASAGLFSYFLFIDHVHYLAAVAAAAALIAFFTLRSLKTDATEEPSPGEWLLAAWTAVAYPTLGALIGLMNYGIGFSLAALAGYALTAFGFAPGIDPSAWGYWTSLPLVALFAAALVAAGTRDLFSNLYPPTAGSRSAFYHLLGRPWTIALVAFAVIAALVLMLVFLDYRATWFPILLALLLAYSSLPLARLGQRRPAKREVEIVEKLARLLTGAGYSVMRSPRTGKPEIDPMIQGIDMLARSTANAFAVQVKSSETAALVEWNEAAALRTASSVLAEELGGDLKTRIEPILVLVGARLAPSLERFSAQERVPVLQLADPSILESDPEQVVSRLRAIGVPFPAAELSPSLGAS
jgi:hypothetical protein